MAVIKQRFSHLNIKFEFIYKLGVLWYSAPIFLVFMKRVEFIKSILKGFAVMFGFFKKKGDSAVTAVKDASDISDFWLLSIKGMTCGGCVKGVERALAGVSGVSAVSVDLQSESAEVRGQGVAIWGLLEALKQKGFEGQRSA